MDIPDERFDLLKINLVITAAVLTAIQLDFNRTDSYVLIGGGTLAFCILIQYLHLMPDVHFSISNTDYMRENTWDTFIILSTAGFLFILIGFCAPYFKSDILSQNPFISNKYTIYLMALGLGIFRIMTIKRNPDREVTLNLYLMLITGYFAMAIFGVLVYLA